MASQHVSVLVEELVAGLALMPTATVIDATLGSGGHARRVLRKLTKGGTFVGIDADPSAVRAAKDIEKSDATVHLINKNFRYIDEVCNTLKLECIHGIYADLGWRIEQYEESGKGFSFIYDEPLVMTYGDPDDIDQYPFTAAAIVNTWEEESIANVLYGYAEERYARRIARQIVADRIHAPIETTHALVETVTRAVPSRYAHGRLHPATKTFQALRIAVNDELGALETCIEKSVPLLTKEGRIAIITFHSIEDRMVKQLFRTYEEEGVGRRITKKPITPSDEEIRQNPRARSAKLRILEKL